MRLIIRRIVFALAMPLLFFSAPAHAKPGLMVVNWGDELFQVANFQYEFSIRGQPQSSVMAIGYKCSHFGLFWADVFTWDCTIVQLMDDERYRLLPDSVASQLRGDARYKFSKATRSGWNHYGFWIFFLAFSYWLYRAQVKFNAEVARAKTQKAALMRRQQRPLQVPASAAEVRSEHTS